MTISAPTVELQHGVRMPVLGLGTSPMNDDETATAVRIALQTGYRLVDTAENYRNEVGVGRGLRDSGIAREDVFITSKFNKEWHSVDGVRTAFDNSVAKLGVDYLDLLLIHWPNPGQDRYVDAWRGLIKLQQEGLVKAIGTSNFKPSHLQRIIDETGVAPDVNQINLNPYTTRDATVAYNREHKIITEAWSPLKPAEILSEPVITAAAEQHNRTPGQVVLRWHTQLGYVTVPKSSSPERIRDNISIFDFDLTDEEIGAICALDKGEDHIADSDKAGH
jgi:2,5-diketo-D-gluconate reductase A